MSGRDRVDRLFEELEVERGVSMQCLTERVSAMLGTDIEVQVLDEDEWRAVPRFVLVDGDRATIAVRRSDPRWYRLHAVAHQLAHLLCGHTRCESLPMTFDQLRKPARVPTPADVGDAVGSAATAAGWEGGDRESVAEALAHRLSAFVLVPRPVPTEVCRELGQLEAAAAMMTLEV